LLDLIASHESGGGRGLEQLCRIGSGVRNDVDAHRSRVEHSFAPRASGPLAGRASKSSFDDGRRGFRPADRTVTAVRSPRRSLAPSLRQAVFPPMISAVRAASLASASLSVLAFSAPVLAEAPIDTGPTQVSEIVVTAERREIGRASCRERA